MAESTLAIDTDLIIDLTGATANDQDILDGIHDEIVTKFNEALETTTGHSHDGADSRSVGAGVSGLSVTELSVARLLGVTIYS